jgi:hypothetical protein
MAAEEYGSENTTRTDRAEHGFSANVAQMTEGGAWAELHRKNPNPINAGVDCRQSLPSNFTEYVKRVFIPQRRENWKEDSTEKTTMERFESNLFPSLESFELRDLPRDRLQRFLNEQARSGLSRSVVDHLRWDLNAIFKLACPATIFAAELAEENGHSGPGLGEFPGVEENAG